jgi:hypothetical protein
VPKRLKIILLGVAAVASVAVAGVRIAHALETRSTREWRIPFYGDTPAEVASVVARLHTPPGFREVRCAVPSENACFRSRTPFVDAVKSARRLVEQLGVPLETLAGKAEIGCDTFLPGTCLAYGTIGRDVVMVWVRQPEVVTEHPTTARYRREFRRILHKPPPTEVHRSHRVPGTEVEVGINGHCLHLAQCEEVKREEEKEAVAASGRHAQA